jgi:hypothetical protein
MKYKSMAPRADIGDPKLGPRFGLGPQMGTPIWDPDLGPRFGTPIWDPDFGP